MSTQRQVCQQQQKQTQQEVALHRDTWVACLVQACRKWCRKRFIVVSIWWRKCMQQARVWAKNLDSSVFGRRELMREKERASLVEFSDSGSACSHAGLLVWSNGITGGDCKQCSPGSTSHWTSLEMTDMGSWGHLKLLVQLTEPSGVSSEVSELLPPVWLAKGCPAAHNPFLPWPQD